MADESQGSAVHDSPPESISTRETMHKTIRDWPVASNLKDYDLERESFSWGAARAELAGLPNGEGLNIAYEAVDRHAQGDAGRALAAGYDLGSLRSLASVGEPLTVRW